MNKLINILPIKRIKTWILLLVTTTLLFSAIAFTTAKQEFKTVRSIDIQISQNYKHEFIDAQDVLNLMSLSGR
ncbi:MAG TPA: hypothetical protein VL947_09005, partial [Cytophagales bacterium]|nr:hypothetical protein [Cytophagales bacterium]